MVISKSTQLGLIFEDNNIKVDFLRVIEKRLQNEVDSLKDNINKRKEFIQKNIEELQVLGIEPENMNDFQLPISTASQKNGYLEDYVEMLTDRDSKVYLITNGVFNPAKMIRIGENFTTSIMKNVQLGKHTYLMGKNEFCRFINKGDKIFGVYWNRLTDVAFSYIYNLEQNECQFPPCYREEFTKITQLITFIELGDIEIVYLKPRQNNNKKKEEKIHNSTNYTVYVVDSTWNQMLIRTDGFAVRGHFRLQPCGLAMKDRKLIWISAFEKNGYTRRPKAEILD